MSHASQQKRHVLQYAATVIPTDSIPAHVTISISAGTQETTAAEACWTKENICTLCQHTSGNRRVRACICSPQKTDCHAVFVSCQHNEREKGKKRNTGCISALQQMMPTHTWHYNTLYILYWVIYNSVHVRFIQMSFRQYEFFSPLFFPVKVTMFGYEI